MPKEILLDLSEESMRKTEAGWRVRTRYGTTEVREYPAMKIPYRGSYPSAARVLMEEGLATRPRQIERTFSKYWAKAGVDIIYTLRGVGPAVFRKHADTFLLLAYQESMRYNGVANLFNAGFDVRLIRTKRGKKDNYPEVVTFQAHLNDEPDIMVWGPNYEVEQKVYLVDKVDQLLDIVKRYGDGVQKQRPFRVIRFFVQVRDR